VRTGALLGSLTIPGRPECVHVAREFVAARLRDGYACADTAVLLTSELVTNSAVHSDSRRHGGTVTVTLIAVPDGIRAEVIDEGGVTVPSLRPGPQLIEALSARWDYWSDEAGTVTWFELTEPAP
jgi:anti-sigma regulatory factor (Ser/Thr protein kinase)